MKFLLLLALLIPSLAFGAASSGNVSNVIQLGGADSFPGGLNIAESYLESASGVSYFMLVSGAGPGATSNIDYAYPLYKNGVQYQVTAGKSAVCTQLSMVASNVNFQIQFFSSTSSYAFNTAIGSVPGVKVYEGGASGNYPHFGNATAYIYHTEQMSYVFAASTYPGIETGSAGSTFGVKLFCKEQ